MTRRFALPAMLVAAVALAAGCGTTDSADKESSDSGSSTKTIKAAWIYVGSVDDAGWTAAHDAGRKYVAAKLGGKLKTTFKESVPEGPQAGQVIEDLVRDGNKIIFATSFGYQDAMAAAAAKHPDVYFEQATGSKVSKNLAQYFGAGEDAIFLAGMAAGAASKKDTLGYVSPFPIPEVIRHVNAYTLGARTTNPQAKVKVVWTTPGSTPTRRARRRRASSRRARTSSARARTARRRARSPSRRASNGRAMTPTSGASLPTRG